MGDKSTSYLNYLSSPPPISRKRAQTIVIVNDPPRELLPGSALDWLENKANDDQELSLPLHAVRVTGKPLDPETQHSGEFSLGYDDILEEYHNDPTVPHEMPKRRSLSNIVPSILQGLNNAIENTISSRPTSPTTGFFGSHSRTPSVTSMSMSTPSSPTTSSTPAPKRKTRIRSYTTSTPSSPTSLSFFSRREEPADYFNLPIDLTPSSPPSPTTPIAPHPLNAILQSLEPADSGSALQHSKKARASPPPAFLLDDDPFANLTGPPSECMRIASSSSSAAASTSTSGDPLPKSIPRSPLQSASFSTMQSDGPRSPSPPPKPFFTPARPQPRPASQKPAFKSRPSLPSLSTLARMNVVVAPRKPRKGRPGAGLPFEPWDNLDDILPLSPGVLKPGAIQPPPPTPVSPSFHAPQSVVVVDPDQTGVTTSLSPGQKPLLPSEMMSFGALGGSVQVTSVVEDESQQPVPSAPTIVPELPDPARDVPLASATSPISPLSLDECSSPPLTQPSSPPSLAWPGGVEPAPFLDLDFPPLAHPYNIGGLSAVDEELVTQAQGLESLLFSRFGRTTPTEDGHENESGRERETSLEESSYEESTSSSSNSHSYGQEFGLGYGYDEHDPAPALPASSSFFSTHPTDYTPLISTFSQPLYSYTPSLTRSSHPSSTSLSFSLSRSGSSRSRDSEEGDVDVEDEERLSSLPPLPLQQEPGREDDVDLDSERGRSIFPRRDGGIDDHENIKRQTIPVSPGRLPRPLSPLLPPIHDRVRSRSIIDDDECGNTDLDFNLDLAAEGVGVGVGIRFGTDAEAGLDLGLERSLILSTTTAAAASTRLEETAYTPTFPSSEPLISSLFSSMTYMPERARSGSGRDMLVGMASSMVDAPDGAGYYTNNGYTNNGYGSSSSTSAPPPPYRMQSNGYRGTSGRNGGRNRGGEEEEEEEDDERRRRRRQLGPNGHATEHVDYSNPTTRPRASRTAASSEEDEAGTSDDDDSTDDYGLASADRVSVNAKLDHYNNNTYSYSASLHSTTTTTAPAPAPASSSSNNYRTPSMGYQAMSTSVSTRRGMVAPSSFISPSPPSQPRSRSASTAVSDLESSDDDEDDIPLAQRIPGALTAQRSIQQKVKEEREQRKKERERTRQVTLRPAGAGVVGVGDMAGMSSSHEAAVAAVAAAQAASGAQPTRRPRTQTLPGKATQPFSPEDLSRKLQNVQMAAEFMPSPQQQLVRPRTKSVSRTSQDVYRSGGGSGSVEPPSPPLPAHLPLRTKSVKKYPPPPTPPSPAPQAPPLPPLRPKRSFHRPGPPTPSDRRPSFGFAEQQQESAPPLPTSHDSEQKLGRSVTSVQSRSHRGSPASHTRTLSLSRGHALPDPSSDEPPVPPLPSRMSQDDVHRKLVRPMTADRSPRPSMQQPLVGNPPSSSKGVSSQQRVFVGDMQRFNMVEVGPSTTAQDVIDMIDGEGGLKNWVGTGGWMVFEVAQDFGMERPVRGFELLEDVQASWMKDKTVNYFVLRLTTLSAPLARSAIPQSSPTHSGYVEWEAKRGKWSKRWLQLREHGIWLSKRDNRRDEVLLCSLSTFDAYHVTRAHRAPKPFAFAIKSTDNLSLFENTADYLHTFSCSEKDGRVWMEKILVARSYVLYQERHVLFAPKASSGGTGATNLSRSTTKKSPGPSQRPLQPLLTVPSGDVFEPGSLLAKHI